MKDQCPNHVDEGRVEPAVGTAPTSAAYETAALLSELYGHWEPTKGSRTLDRPFTKRGLHLARRRSSRGGNRTHNVFRPPINSRAPCHSEHPGMWGGPRGPPRVSFRRTGEAAQHAAHVSDGRAKVLPGFQGTRLPGRSQLGVKDSNLQQAASETAALPIGRTPNVCGSRGNRTLAIRLRGGCSTFEL